MITYGNERVTLTSGAPSIETIGVSLGRIVRFAGHTKHFYSVLAHSLTVAAIMPPEYGIYGLMHDAQESLVSDVPTPMKSQVARNREHTLQKRIYVANGLPWPLSEDAVTAVEEADATALVAEAHLLEHPGAEAQFGSDYDATAAKYTRRHMQRVLDWLEPEKAAGTFVRAFKKYSALAGLDGPGEWK